MAEEVSDGARPARDGHAALHRRAHLLRAVRDGDQRPRPSRDLPDRLAGGDRDRQSHTKARILDVRADRIRRRWTRTTSCWSPAFRASRPPPDVTTLGRGGSDTTAVAVAAALGAEVCEIYTDVPGVFSADPRIVPDARKLEHGLLRGDARDGRLRRGRAAAALGRVRAQPRRAHPLPLLLRRPSRYRCGLRRREHGPQSALITAVTHSTSEAMVTLVGVRHTSRARPRASSRRWPRPTSTWT